MKVVIDRIEGPYAVCEREDRSMINIHIEKLPSGAKEGDVLNIEDGRIYIDTVETDKRRRKIGDMIKHLWE